MNLTEACVGKKCTNNKRKAESSNITISHKTVFFLQNSKDDDKKINQIKKNNKSNQIKRNESLDILIHDKEHTFTDFKIASLKNC